jgi:hypothetical protein
MVQGRKTQLLIFLTPEERRTLEAWQRSTPIGQGLAKRGKSILLLSEQVPISVIARRIGIARGPIYKWAKRFRKQRLEGLKDESGRGRRPFFPSGDRGAGGQDRL